MSDIYLRDLKGTLREETERDIKEKRPDLIPWLEDGNDIVIGEAFDKKDYRVA